MSPPERAELMPGGAEADQLGSALSGVTDDRCAHVSSPNDLRVDLRAVRVTLRAGALEQVSRLVLLAPHVCVERKRGRDLDHDEGGQSRVVVGGEPTGDLEGVQRLGTRVEEDEHAAVPAYRRGEVTLHHTQSGGFDGLKPDPRSRPGAAAGPPSR